MQAIWEEELVLEGDTGHRGAWAAQSCLPYWQNVHFTRAELHHCVPGQNATVICIVTSPDWHNSLHQLNRKHLIGLEGLEIYKGYIPSHPHFLNHRWLS